MSLRPISFLLGLLCFASVGLAGPRDAQWAKVDAAVHQGLPRTAIRELDPIITAAVADHAYPEAVRAITRKIALEGQIAGNDPVEKIKRLQAAIARAAAPMKPTMEAILADWYWDYFQQNRWRFLQRTRTTGPAGPDIATWSLPQILTAIDRHFSAALADPASLQATPIQTYDALLVKGTVPDRYRPTLFDFLANEALAFYEAGEQGAVAPADTFEITADSPVFADARHFLAWQLPPSTHYSPRLKALRIFQALLRFHAHDTDRSAFLDADLNRLVFGGAVAVGSDRSERYKAALMHFADAHADDELSARALAMLGQLLIAEGDPRAAHVLAERGYHAFPNAPGGAACWNELRQIEAPSARLETERVWNAPWPTLNVTYRNLRRIYFRAIPIDFAAHLVSSRTQSGSPVFPNRNPRLDQLRTPPPALTWDTALPATPDYKERTVRLPAPTTLKPGFYYIVASSSRSLSTDDNQISVAAVWVSNLALITRFKSNRNTWSGLVVRADTGDPVAGATIRRYKLDRAGYYTQLAPLTTDANGRFVLSQADGSQTLVAEHNGQAVSNNAGYLSILNSPASTTRTFFFTDRAIYRPGQTIQYSGICVNADPKAGKYHVIADETVEVAFRDANGREITRATHRTNAFGSFSGVFTAPRHRLTGWMNLVVTKGPKGAASVSVEEYKRPQFEVTLEPPASAARLNTPVVITGRARAYTGAPVDGATVHWRVSRRAVLPLWCWWWHGPTMTAIAHGTAVTQADGTFRLQFPATPDAAIPVANQPTFVFAVHADVTDSAGETRSDNRDVRVGYTALTATVQAADWQTPDKPVAFTVTTRSLDDDPVPATGTLTVHTLQQPPAVAREPLVTSGYRPTSSAEPNFDATNPDSWPVGREVWEHAFTTDRAGRAELKATLPAGIYRVSLATMDRFGHPVTARQTVQVIDPEARQYPVKLANHFTAATWTVEPGDTFTALWGTGYPTGRAYIEVECAGKTLARYWTADDRTQTRITFPVTKAMRGGVTVRATFVRDNRAYFNQRVVNVPWSNKKLTVKWEHFRSKLTPGARETWTAVVTGPDARRASAEMVATLYDASLDQFRSLSWPQEFFGFRSEDGSARNDFTNSGAFFEILSSWKQRGDRPVIWRYRKFPAGIVSGVPRNFEAFESVQPMVFGLNRRRARILAGEPGRALLRSSGVTVDAMSPVDDGVRFDFAGSSPKPDQNLNAVGVRRNLQETAFFYPHLLTDKDGVVRIQFTMPEALTTWRFLGFAHDRELRSGFLTAITVTAKDLMVQPNPPRFLRAGDTVEFTVTVTNQSHARQQGTVRLTFADAATLKSVDDALGNRVPEQPFDVPAGRSRSYAWRISVPGGLGVLTYKAVGASSTLSDGEEGYLPVLSRRVLVTESLPLTIRGPGTKHFEFTKLLASGQSPSQRSVALTAQMTSQPAWYAVMALPYLMQFPYECSEQVFNRLYANALARHIANSDPKIRRIFDLWKNTPALDSPLEKNPGLKSLLLEETPWVQQAESETQARHNVGLLFDANRLDADTATTLRKLTHQQLHDGRWPWFPGGPGSDYITLYIVSGFGRLRHLGVPVDVQPALKAIASLDAWIGRRYRDVQREAHPENDVPDPAEALYLYGRSFFLAERPISAADKPAVDFFLRQARTHWVDVRDRQSQAHLALALQRFGDTTTPAAIVRSLKERSIDDPEQGMYWRDSKADWWWYRAPIETQAMMIEAFSEITHDARAVADCKAWLLNQKRTQDWGTTKATADAVYALLLGGGESLLASDAPVRLALGGVEVKPAAVEAGTGFYEQKFTGPEIKPAMGDITVTKTDAGVSWGSVHWQYLEDLAKVTAPAATPLTVTKTLFVRETTADGPVLKPVNGPLAVGDELVVRLVVRTDRDLEFVHLQDQRGSGTEPVDVLSRYRYQDGLAYYEATRDTATDFFFDRLPKGTHVFEYSTRVQLKGRYQCGIAKVECMYAPEFNSHSASTLLEVK